MPDLLDANVWVALSHPDHIHHGVAVHYWESAAARRLAYCRTTSLALLRLLTNRHVMAGNPLSSVAAWEVLTQWLEHQAVGMADEPARLTEVLGGIAATNNLLAGEWTDAYLAAFAMAGGYRLVTFDQDFARFDELDLLHLHAETELT